MKNFLKSCACLLLAVFIAPVFSAASHPDAYYGLPGDDFSLEGALDLFKRSNSLEAFERELNSPDNNVNNLDLNYNGRIDYLRVVDHAEGDLHAIVIQALLDQGMSQDVAVIQVKRNRYGEAVVQIVGDEDLYGTAKIVEPYPYDDVAGPTYYDDYYDHYSPTVFVNVWAWPVIRFIYAPRYVVWVSPYYYNYYPVWYSPWGPHPYHVWRSRTVVYHHYYCVAPDYRIPEANHYYGSRRVYAPVVRQRTERYVADHGGRANFSHGKRADAVDAPRSRSLDRTDKTGVANSRNRQREQSPSTRPQAEKPAKTPPVSAGPQAEKRSPARSREPATATPDNRRREQSPSANRPPTVQNRNPQKAAPERSASPRANNSVKQEQRTPQAAAPKASRRAAPDAPKAAPPAANSRPRGKAGSSPVEKGGRSPSGKGSN